MKRFGCQWERRTSFYETISNAIITILAVLILLFWPAAGRGDTTPSDDTAVFTNIAPDALLVLDLSTSMSWNPAGEHDSGNHPINKWGKTNACTDLSSYGGDYTVDCSRLAIAKRAIFNILDANSDATINSADSDYLNVRIGYMRFTNGDDTAGDYNSGNIQLIRPLGTSYSNIYCSNKTSCTITSGSSSSSCINGESANGGTPLASALNEAKLYLDDNKANDKTAGACRQKFVIVITDGADTYACGGNGTETQKTQYQRRREVVARTKALADAGYKVFVIGFGNGMPGYLQSTLNWMAYYGGTDNPTITNSGDTDGYSITTGLYPSGVSGACYAEPDASLSGTCDGTSTACFATTNDPGNLSLDGYAFLASSATDLSNALKAAITIIHESTYSFTQASVQSLRTKDENYLYEGSVGYIATDPFWRGHLKKYQINDDGTVGDVIWDAGDLLAAKSSDSRTMWTWKSGSRTLFTTSNITAADLGVTSAKDPETQRLKIIGFVRGDASYNLEGWKLGDIFHAPPVTIGSPSDFYNDVHDQNNAFAAFRTAHQRTSANGKRLVVAGANDGQVHAFSTTTGAEIWSIIPPNFLPRFQMIAHNTHPTSLTHQYFMDGPITVADVWLGTGDGTAKSSADWKTYMMIAEGKGGSDQLWSSSTACDSGFSSAYSTTYSNYCGIYAFDVSDSTVSSDLPPDPIYKWHLNPTGTNAPFLAQPWSKMMIGRIKDGGTEKWVGFIGAGYQSSDCSGGGSCNPSGKGFFVVNLSDGTILWSFTYGATSTATTSTDMMYSLPGTPAIVDTDNDGFIDTAYIGDLGGNVWRFRFCTNAAGSSCTTSNWTGKMLYDSSSGTIRPIFTMPSIARDSSGDLWVYWGTGDKYNPTVSNNQEKLYALKDNDLTTTYRINDMENIGTGTYSGTKSGWYTNLNGEKMIADPVVFGGVVYFTTYTHPSGSDVCTKAGTSGVYALNFATGGGMFSSGTRSQDAGSGIASSPVISLGPTTTDLYITPGEGGTFRVSFNPPNLANRRSLLHWWDKKIK